MSAFSRTQFLGRRSSSAGFTSTRTGLYDRMLRKEWQRTTKRGNARKLAGGPEENCPAGEESQTAEGRNRTEPTSAGESEQIKAARKNYDTGDKRPTGHMRTALRPTRNRPRHPQKAESMVHLISDADLENGEHVWRKPILECMGSEGAERDSQKCQRGSSGEKKAIHASGGPRKTGGQV